MGKGLVGVEKHNMHRVQDYFGLKVLVHFQHGTSRFFIPFLTNFSNLTNIILLYFVGDCFRIYKCVS